MLNELHLSALMEIAGPGGATRDPDMIAPHVREWRDKYQGSTPLMLMPGRTDTVSRLMAYCHKHDLQVVPQGGNTGLVGGGIPGLEGRSEILLSLKRMTRIGEADFASWTLEAEAGVPIAVVQEQAAAADLMFPLSLASEGSCTVGGTIATNAGGVHVIRYGSMRALVAGLEAVLPDGQVINTLSPLEKDNSGYDLKNLLAGSEGTLAVITRARLKLSAPERVRATAWIGAASLDEALAVLHAARSRFADSLSAFETISEAALGLALRHIEGARPVLTGSHPWHLLMELGSADAKRPLGLELESWLADMFDAGTIADASLAQSEAQRQSFWRMREGLSEAQKHEGVSIKHDIALPLDQINAFVRDASAAINDRWPSARLTPFGHLGDGNLHFNVMQGEGEDGAIFRAAWDEMQTLVHSYVTRYGGSISAEHGIGRMKRGALMAAKPDSHMAILKAIKTALDPKGILNPGVFFDRP